MWWLGEECQHWPGTSGPPGGWGSTTDPSERCQPDKVVKGEVMDLNTILSSYTIGHWYHFVCCTPGCLIGYICPPTQSGPLERHVTWRQNGCCTATGHKICWVPEYSATPVLGWGGALVLLLLSKVLNLTWTTDKYLRCVMSTLL